MGHDHLLEIRLLKKSARHNFSFARHHSSKCNFLSTVRKSKIIINHLPYVYFEQFHFYTKQY